ncbi:DUF2334 domain-containing protein [Clostridium massiliamazoniense]|uniref:DUF2334 domain-containing protein n=1 Tax=Clostridium massiliamazoniense TaxID=1347366 RepID=UPI0006D81E72|nr:DUF2334 domain-containing protein [Clostridium massiliamazoniense]
MLKKTSKVIGLSLATVLVGGVIYFNGLTYRDVKVIDNKIIFDGKVKEAKEQVTNASSTNESKIYEIENLKLYLNGEEIKLENRILEKNQRLYMDLDDFLKKANLNYEKKNKVYKVENSLIDLENKNFTVNGKLYDFRGEALLGLEGYVALNDLEHALNLRDRWKNESNEIYLFKEKKNLDVKKTMESKTGKAAMMRVEDLAAGGEYLKSESIEKYKILADYLYSQGVKFNVAWISRYKNPPKGIDNDLLSNRTMENVQYINLMDHLIFRGASIGLHGYTHQNGDEVSAVGSDLSRKANNTGTETEAIITNAIKTAKTLNIPIDFFESAHYHASMKQQRIIEKYFDIAYEPFKYYPAMNPIKSPMDKSTLYLPTTIGYVKDETGEEITNKIRKNANSKKITSFYFHARKEFNFIKLGEIDKDGYVDYSYDENSIMHNISKALAETNQVTVAAKDFR